MRFFAETKLADGALLDVEDLRKELTVPWPGMRMSSPKRFAYCWKKSGRVIGFSMFVERKLHLMSNRKPPSGGCSR